MEEVNSIWLLMLWIYQSRLTEIHTHISNRIVITTDDKDNTYVRHFPFNSTSDSIAHYSSTCYDLLWVIENVIRTILWIRLRFQTLVEARNCIYLQLKGALDIMIGDIM